MTVVKILDDFLAHHGVKGMKWGQRKALSMTERQIKLHKDARDGKGLVGLVAKPDKLIWGGGGRFDKFHNKKIEELENSKKQIEDGKKIVRTILTGAQYTKTKKSKS